MPAAVVGGDSAGAAVANAVKHATSHADFAARFKHPIKFNGKDFVETRLTNEEQIAEVTKVASTKLHVFLERYGTLLSKDDLRALAACPAGETAEARFWLQRYLKAPCSASDQQKQGRRRRWMWAKREMAKPGGFFSEDEMKLRDPKLFHSLVGRFLEPTTSLSSPMQGSLSTYLMQRLEQECDLAGAGASAASNASKSKIREAEDELDDTAKRQRRNLLGEGREGDADDDDFMSDDDDGEPGRGPEGGAPDDTAVRRAKFLKQMRDRFVNGTEPGFNYASIDEDSDLEDLAEMGRDAEERYFDDDEQLCDDDDDL